MDCTNSYAAGHGLAPCSYWPGSFMYDSGPHIKKLVQIRMEYEDALIYGAQSDQPPTGNPLVLRTGSREASTGSSPW